MTENSFIAVCQWLLSHYLKQNSIHIVFQVKDKGAMKHEAWKFAGVIGNDKIKLERSQGHGKPCLTKTIEKNSFQTLDNFLACVQISLSKESILKSYKESKA